MEESGDEGEGLPQIPKFNPKTLKGQVTPSHSHRYPTRLKGPVVQSAGTTMVNPPLDSSNFESTHL